MHVDYRIKTLPLEQMPLIRLNAFQCVPKATVQIQFTGYIVYYRAPLCHTYHTNLIHLGHHAIVLL